MRCPSAFSERMLRPSFFLTTPAKKPRTECCCQSVAFMTAAMVVPFGCRNSPSTASCFDEVPVDLAEACLGVAILDAVFLGRGFFAEGWIGRAGFATLFADFDFDLLAAIWPSLMSTPASCAATDTKPAEVINAGGRDRPNPENNYVL